MRYLGWCGFFEGLSFLAAPPFRSHRPVFPAAVGDVSYVIALLSLTGAVDALAGRLEPFAIMPASPPHVSPICWCDVFSATVIPSRCASSFGLLIRDHFLTTYLTSRRLRRATRASCSPWRMRVMDAGGIVFLFFRFVVCPR